MATKGLGHWGDEADFAGGAVSKAVFAGGFAAFMGNLLERPAGVDSLVDFGGGNNEAASPVAGGLEPHEPHKKHHEACFGGPTRHGVRLLIGDAADQHSHNPHPGE